MGPADRTESIAYGQQGLANRERDSNSGREMVREVDALQAERGLAEGARGHRFPPSPREESRIPAVHREDRRARQPIGGCAPENRSWEASPQVPYGRFVGIIQAAVATRVPWVPTMRTFFTLETPGNEHN